MTPARAVALACLLALPLVAPKIRGAGEIEYFSYLRSAVFDHDLEFGNEYAHFYEADPAGLAGFKATFLDLREPATGDLWELIVQLEGAAGSPLVARLARGGGLDHVCLELEAADGSLDDVLAGEVARGGRVVCPPVTAAAFGRRIAFVYRRSGRVIEFVEARPPGARL